MKYRPLLAISFVASFPLITLAGGGEGFTPLVGIPGLEDTDSFDGYVDALYALAISIAALVAVVKIVLAGAKYMMDDIVTHKSEAKQDIKNALIGLLIIIGAVIILNTINSDLTNLSINTERAFTDQTLPAFQLIDEVAAMYEDALQRNTEVQSIACSSAVNPNASISACERLCSDVYQGVMDYTGINECFYIQEDADQCDPTQTADCCVNVKGGEWENTTCTGLEAAEDARIIQCYSGGNGTWDEVNNTCRTTDCDPNESSDCCELGYGGTLSGGTCVTAVQSELDCVNTNGIWNSQTNTCTPQNVANNKTTCEAQGAGFVWRAGSCLEYTNTFPAQTDNCAIGDVNCLSSLCQSGGLGIVYIPELQMCGTDPNALN
jgi:Type IV secretion system pilin